MGTYIWHTGSTSAPTLGKDQDSMLPRPRQYAMIPAWGTRYGIWHITGAPKARQITIVVHWVTLMAPKYVT